MATRPLHAGYFPTRATAPIAANTLIERGMLVQINASGLAVPGAAANGFVTIGMATHTIDNRTGSALGGAASAADVECICGIVGLVQTTTGFLPGDLAYVAGAYTVTETESTNGFAGVVHEVRDGAVWVWVCAPLAGLLKLASVP
jgi:hypothetical protein